jgi:hypothetical protein
MGLSDNERLQNIYFVLNKVSQLLKNFERKRNFNKNITVSSEVEDLLVLCNKLWPAFLGSPNKGYHWLIGSGCENAINDKALSPWEVSIQNTLEKVYKNLIEDNSQDQKEFVAYFEEHKKNLTDFTIPRLLEFAKHHDFALTFELYRKMESLVYYLRRYEDDFVRDHDTLNDLINQIFGACYGIFNDPHYNIWFSKAYCIREYFTLLYGSVYEEDNQKYDVVHEVLFENISYFSVKIKQSMFAPIEEVIIMPISLIQSATKDDINKTKNHLHKRMQTLMYFVDKKMYKKIKRKIKESVLVNHLHEYKKIVNENKKESEDKKDICENYTLKQVSAFGDDAFYDLEKKIREEVG